MLFLHERHEIRAGAGPEFEAAYRDEWMPRLARADDARLIWYWRHANASSRPNNIVTITAVKSAAALGRLSESLQGGDFAQFAASLDPLRHQVVSSVLAPTRFSELNEIDFASVPADPKQRHARAMYVEDVVWPPSLDDYVAMAGENWYRPAAAGTGKVRARITHPAFFQVAYGAGVRPEVYLIQKLIDPPEMFVRNLLATDYPPEMKAPDHYFVRGLKVRDQWESRIMATSEWSPLD
jgi:hypothetical protein